MAGSALDKFAGTPQSLTGPYENAAAVTPSNTTKLDYLTSALYVGGAGAVSVLLRDGTTVVFAVVPAGTTIPIRAKRVNASGTAATGIVALW